MPSTDTISTPSIGNGQALSHSRIFSILGESMSDLAVLVLAEHDGRRAGALN